MIENEKIEEMTFELEEKCENTLRALENDYGAIRTGRANPRILDRLEVETCRRWTRSAFKSVFGTNRF